MHRIFDVFFILLLLLTILAPFGIWVGAIMAFSKEYYFEAILGILFGLWWAYCTWYSKPESLVENFIDAVKTIWKGGKL